MLTPFYIPALLQTLEIQKWGERFGTNILAEKSEQCGEIKWCYPWSAYPWNNVWHVGRIGLVVAATIPLHVVFPLLYSLAQSLAFQASPFLGNLVVLPSLKFDFRAPPGLLSQLPAGLHLEGDRSCCCASETSTAHIGYKIRNRGLPAKCWQVLFLLWSIDKCFSLLE